jgi:hypothetical protein
MPTGKELLTRRRRGSHKITYAVFFFSVSHDADIQQLSIDANWQGTAYKKE